MALFDKPQKHFRDFQNFHAGRRHGGSQQHAAKGPLMEISGRSVGTCISAPLKLFQKLKAGKLKTALYGESRDCGWETFVSTAPFCSQFSPTILRRSRIHSRSTNCRRAWFIKGKTGYLQYEDGVVGSGRRVNVEVGRYWNVLGGHVEDPLAGPCT
jgi:hypothetical protein